LEGGKYAQKNSREKGVHIDKVKNKKKWELERR
jgi:hypothetical protein